MNPRIAEACDSLAEPSGEMLLRLLWAVYVGADQQTLDVIPAEVRGQAEDLGLLTTDDERLTLTEPGYLVGNVAKEYCHWIDNGRQMPPPRPPEALVADKDVLDLGCSFGRWLWEFQKIARSVVGLELQQEYLSLGRALAEREGICPPEILQGSAEDVDLYVAANSKDFVFARLLFNHVYIKRTLRKIAGILRPSGVLWMQIEPLWLPFRNLAQRAPGRELRSKVFAIFAIVNSLVFMATGAQMHLSVRGRMHSVHKPAYPTLRSWKTVLASIGLREFQVVRGAEGSPVFYARKT